MVMAYNPEDVGSKPTTGNIPIWSFYRNAPRAATHIRAHILNLLSSEEERAAHNREVVRIKTNRRYFHLGSFKEAAGHMLSDAKHSKHTYHRHGAEVSARGS